ncbi:PDZ domain-containing protein [Luteolibacter pohnpeiensis]|uniref:PDZ domain-containing protein n=1 Tax=Luteolibacter pohnpeiensis TaxID=454153 RepID=A0A934VU72_9BACT|nr:trypsin-like peptidase domain-containing protein [Luteolibacter pohnpeiensis]MBK1882217.1 PDZ domain-containing protein [Luteolibacter pohnpeiensis]
MNAKLIPFILLLAGSLQAAQTLETANRRNGNSVVAAFEMQRQVLQTSSAVILDKRAEIGYGVVISADGYILAKASELVGVSNLWVRVDTDLYREVKLLGTDEDWDVALLKIEATDLTPVSYAPSSDVPQGTWVVANGATSLKARRALVGIISAKTRTIPDGGGNLGISIQEKSGAVIIEDLDPKGGASLAGLKKDDQIVEIDGHQIGSFDDVVEVMKERRAGTAVKMMVLRDGKEITAEPLLKPGPLTRNDTMSGAFSQRRSGFPRVLQHDIIANKEMIGGPLLDLQGRCLGMNIARANRAESYAIPVEDLKKLAERLMKQYSNG